MRRRFVEIFVAAAVLLVPALTLALPRPEQARQTNPEQQVCFPDGPCDILVPSSTPAGTATPQLIKDRIYRVEVQGTWLYEGSGSPNKKADAVCATSDGSTWTRSSDKGIQIQNTFYGGTRDCRSDHKYSFEIGGSGSQQGEALRIIDTNYDGNQGNLTVGVWAYYQVTYQLLVESALPGKTIDQEVIPTMTVTPGSVPPITVSPVTIEGVGLPPIGSITFNHDGQLWCVTVSSGSQTIPVGCSFDPGTLIGRPLPDMTIPIGGNVIVPGQTICNPSCEIVPGVPLDPITIPGVTVRGGIPEGSKLQLNISWSADTTKLWKTPANNENPNTGEQDFALYAPFHTTDQNWFVGEVQGGRQGLSIGGTIKDPNGQTVGSIPTVTIPGLGQILEAIFWSQAPV